MFKSIQTKLIFVVIFIVIISVAGVSFITYQQTVVKIEALMGQRAQAIAKTGATLIDGDDHKKIVKNIAAAGKLPEWKKLQEALQRIKKENNLQEDVYTMMDAYWVKPSKDAPLGQVVFTALASTDKFALKGQKKEDYVHRSMEKKEAGYTPIFETENGLFITGYAPILTSKGKVTGVLEVALEAGKEIAQARMSLIKGIAKAAIAALVLSIFLTFFASSNISSPIKTLASVVEKLKSGDLKARVEKIIGKDEIARLGIGFNDMAENLEESYKQLEDYSKNLEEKVKERTAELAAANKKISVMLDSMDLGVFTVDKDYNIQSPTSQFTETIFGTEIAGENILDSVYSQLADNDPIKSSLQTALVSVYGEDDLQWDLMEEHFPRNVEIKDFSNQQDKQLRIRYSPLWSESGELYQILFVVEDITEFLRLEQAANQARKESEETNAILTSLSTLEVDVIKEYFGRTKELIENIEDHVTHNKDLQVVYRDLHTIKGNSRIYNFSLIADTVHVVESELAEYKESQKLNSDEKADFYKGLNAITRALSQYGQMAHKIYKIENLFIKPDPKKYFQMTLDYIGPNHEKYDLEEIISLHHNLDIKETNLAIKKLERNEVTEQAVHSFAIEQLKEHLQNFNNFPYLVPVLVSNSLAIKMLQRLLEAGPARMQKNQTKLNIFLSEARSLAQQENVEFLQQFIDFTSYVPDETVKAQCLWDFLKTSLSLAIAIDLASHIDQKSYDSIKELLHQEKFEQAFEQLSQFGQQTKVYTLLNFLRKTDQDSRELFAQFKLFEPLKVLKTRESIDELNTTTQIQLAETRILVDFPPELGSKISQVPEVIQSIANIIFKSTFAAAAPTREYKVEVPMITVMKDRFSGLLDVIKNKDDRPHEIFKHVHALLDLPVSQITEKYKNLVKDIANRLEKKVDFKIIGSDIAINRNSLYKLDDALVHMLRNSIDHGIEPLEIRSQTQKNEVAKIKLAFETSEAGKTSITISDDGAGIDLDRLKSKIVENENLSLQEIEKKTSQEIYSYIFKPNFSTKEEVTELSGRGVGMTVAKTNVEELGGNIMIQSQRGEGTTFIITI